MRPEDRGSGGSRLGRVGDILVSNEVAGPRKLARFAALSRISTAAICVNSEAGVAALEAAAEDAGARLTALIEIDVGMDRCGVPPGPAVTALARRIAGSPRLRFGGLQAYQGRAQHQRTPEERRASVARAVTVTGETVAALKDAGLDCPIVGGAGTGTFALEAASGVYTELQVGSYVFMDADYARNEQAPPFAQSLFVLATVMSAPRRDLAVVDAGLKALAFDSGPPTVWKRPGVTYAGASDEHGRLVVAADAEPPRFGERILLQPGHCDPTVDRYDWYVGVRGGRVECLWPVAARGAMA